MNNNCLCIAARYRQVIPGESCGHWGQQLDFLLRVVCRSRVQVAGREREVCAVTIVCQFAILLCAREVCANRALRNCAEWWRICLIWLASTSQASSSSTRWTRCVHLVATMSRKPPGGWRRNFWSRCKVRLAKYYSRTSGFCQWAIDSTNALT